MSELVEEIKGILGGRESTVPGLIDPLASTPNRVTDLSPLDEVLRLGLPVMPATKDPYNGILKVKEELSRRDRCGQPTMFFNPDLRRTLMEISRGFIWDGETNKPVKDKDDMMENLYRLCLQGLAYVEPSTYGDYTPISPVAIPNVIDFNTFGNSIAEDRDREERRRRYSTRYAR